MIFFCATVGQAVPKQRKQFNRRAAPRFRTGWTFQSRHHGVLDQGHAKQNVAQLHWRKDQNDRWPNSKVKRESSFFLVTVSCCPCRPFFLSFSVFSCDANYSMKVSFHQRWPLIPPVTLRRVEKKRDAADFFSLFLSFFSPRRYLRPYATTSTPQSHLGFTDPSILVFASSHVLSEVDNWTSGLSFWIQPFSVNRIECRYLLHTRPHTLPLLDESASINVLNLISGEKRGIKAGGWDVIFWRHSNVRKKLKREMSQLVPSWDHKRNEKSIGPFFSLFSSPFLFFVFPTEITISFPFKAGQLYSEYHHHGRKRCEWDTRAGRRMCLFFLFFFLFWEQQLVVSILFD